MNESPSFITFRPFCKRMFLLKTGESEGSIDSYSSSINIGFPALMLIEVMKKKHKSFFFAELHNRIGKRFYQLSSTLRKFESVNLMTDKLFSDSMLLIHLFA